jgi:hypothetical protein
LYGKYVIWLYTVLKENCQITYVPYNICDFRSKTFSEFSVEKFHLEINSIDFPEPFVYSTKKNIGLIKKRCFSRQKCFSYKTLHESCENQLGFRCSSEKFVPNFLLSMEKSKICKKKFIKIGRFVKSFWKKTTNIVWNICAVK